MSDNQMKNAMPATSPLRNIRFMNPSKVGVKRTLYNIVPNIRSHQSEFRGNERPSTTRSRCLEVAIGSKGLKLNRSPCRARSVQHFADLRRQRDGSEWLLQEGQSFFEYAVVHDHVRSVA